MRYVPGQSKDYITELEKTNGDEWMTLDGVEYKGFYHLSSGIPHTGVDQNENSLKLYPYNPDSNFVEYINLHDFYLLDGYYDPINYYPILREKDYEKGVFKRHFIKKRNDEFFRIIEIDKKQFEAWKRGGSGINEKYYFGISLDWKITGVRKDVYKNNKIVIYGVEDTNNRTAILKEKEMKNIRTTLRNLIEFSQLT